MPLDIVDSPYRELTTPVLDYLERLDARWKSDVVTVVIPELVVHRWWQHLLHNQSALWLRTRLILREATVVTSVPAHVLEEGRAKTPIPVRRRRRRGRRARP
ncbi:MAG: hypothetical protein M3046_07540 [Actinomycetota bacterium]|nr:hypothetical protein [Actinomycetota bacterium]